MEFSSGWIILFIPLVGLIPICKDGQWNWNVVSSSKLLSVVFWIGWFSALIVGSGTIIGLFS